MANRDVYAKVFDGIIAAMERGTAPWSKPWRATGSAPGADVPRNAATGRRYSGGNVFALWGTALDRGYALPGWLTFRQAIALGCVVRKGEKGTAVYFMSKLNVKRKGATPDANGELPEDRIFFARQYVVFNVAQLEELEPGALDKLKAKLSPAAPVAPQGDAEAFDVLDVAERIVSATGAHIAHGGDRACYSPVADAITMPRPEDFVHRDHYYATLFHELAHWTGHESRLKRLTPARFGSAEYAFEELVAELASAFLCARLGLNHEEPSAAYLASWAKSCRQHPDMFARAASLAQAAADYVYPEAAEEAAPEVAEGEALAA